MGWSVMGTVTIAAEQMVAAIRALGHVPLWVVSRSARDATQFAEDLSIPQATTDMKRVWQDSAVTAAYVSAARRRRPHYISAAAGARKDILCDGPISESSKGADALVQLCEDAGVLLAVNQPFRASVIHQTMKRLIADGDIGTVQSVLMVRGGPYQPPPNRRKHELDETGQIHLDVSVDDIDLARFLTDAEPSEANALAEQSVKDPDHIAYAIRMSDGSLFQAHESFRTADIDSMVLVAGDRGVLIANGTLNGRASGTLVRKIGGKSELVPVRERDLHLATVEDFVTARDRAPSWLSTGADSVVALRGAEAVAMSARKGRTIAVQT